MLILHNYANVINMVSPNSLPAPESRSIDLELEMLAHTGATPDDLRATFTDIKNTEPIIPVPGTPGFAQVQARLWAMRTPEEAKEFDDAQIQILEDQFGSSDSEPTDPTH